MMNTAPSISAVDFLRQYLTSLSPDLVMKVLGIDEIQAATGNPGFDYSDMVKLAKEIRSNGYDLTPRYADDFSSEPYLWITPSPKSLEPDEAKATIPDSFWIIRNPENTATLRVHEGLLIFSRAGYGAGYMIKQGIGDFNVVPYSKKALIESGVYDHVVLDHVDGHPPNQIPVKS